MSECVKGMTREEVFMELTKDDMGKCSGCDKLIYSNGTMTCQCMQTNQGGYSHEN